MQNLNTFHNLQKLSEVSREYAKINFLYLKHQGNYKDKNLVSPEIGQYYDFVCDTFMQIDDLYKKTLKETNPLMQHMFCDTFLIQLKKFEKPNHKSYTHEEWFKTLLSIGCAKYDEHLADTDYALDLFKEEFQKIETMRPVMEAWYLDKELTNPSAIAFATQKI